MSSIRRVTHLSQLLQLLKDTGCPMVLREGSDRLVSVSENYPLHTRSVDHLSNLY